MFFGLIIALGYYIYRRRSKRLGRASELGSEGSRSPISFDESKTVQKVGGKLREDEKDDGWSQNWPQQKPGEAKSTSVDLGLRISDDGYFAPTPHFTSSLVVSPGTTALVSILKEPPVDPKTTLLFSAQSLLRRPPTYEPTFAEKRPDRPKKGVTFGQNDVRIFGTTPYGSRAGSIDEGYDNEYESNENDDSDSDGGSSITRSLSETAYEDILNHQMEGEVLRRAMEGRPK